jgi:hypothetical protein
LRLGLVAQPAHRRGKDGPLVPLEQRVERLTPALLRSMDQASQFGLVVNRRSLGKGHGSLRAVRRSNANGKGRPGASWPTEPQDVQPPARPEVAVCVT